MAPLLLKHVVRFSSQDSTSGKVENLLKSQTVPSAGRWTCSKEGCCDQLEAEFQLERASRISHVDIGNYGSAFVEVLVGNSMWTPKKDFVSLIPSAMLMTPGDCKQWNQTKSVRMFHGDSLNQKTLSELWDRIRVICRQPFRKDKQFGLSFIRILAPDSQDKSSPLLQSDSNKQFAENVSNCVRQDEVEDTSPALKHLLSRHFKKSPDGQNALNRGSKMLQAALDKPRTPQPNSNPKRSLEMVDSYYGDPDNLRCDDLFGWRGINPWLETGPLQGGDKSLKANQATSELPDKKWSLNGDIEDETECFLDGIDFSKVDMETVTYSDLRSQMEAQRECRLTKAEKKIFLKMAKDVVSKVMEKLETKANDRVESPSESTRSSKKDPDKVSPLSRIKSPATSRVSLDSDSDDGNDLPSVFTKTKPVWKPPITTPQVNSDSEEEDLPSYLSTNSQDTKIRTHKRIADNNSKISCRSKVDSQNCGTPSKRTKQTKDETSRPDSDYDYDTIDVSLSQRARATKQPQTLASDDSNEPSSKRASVYESTSCTRTVISDSDDEVPSKNNFSQSAKAQRNGELSDSDNDLPPVLSRQPPTEPLKKENVKMSRFKELTAKTTKSSMGKGSSSLSASSASSNPSLPSSLYYEPPLQRNAKSDAPIVGSSSASECHVECPICGQLFLDYLIEEHASRYTDFAPCSPPHQSSPEELVDCPICIKRLPRSAIAEHANLCAERSLTSSSHEDGAITLV
ncbi:uncharacterized protein LOC5513107 isoform X2 [Nematostella vectensis]|uniref:uncharacterized protein LOC5513107 isoform X2 n=1 Tax=Nematostella vectensis TaxID=45351 RepID=UPI0020770056|nr:uncharacterized protein LOC5513107 isoform X2 [Nematostella vectensis]